MYLFVLTNSLLAIFEIEWIQCFNLWITNEHKEIVEMLLKIPNIDVTVKTNVYYSIKWNK